MIMPTNIMGRTIVQNNELFNTDDSNSFINIINTHHAHNFSSYSPILKHSLLKEIDK